MRMALCHLVSAAQVALEQDGFLLELELAPSVYFLREARLPMNLTAPRRASTPRELKPSWSVLLLITHPQTIDEIAVGRPVTVRRRAGSRERDSDIAAYQTSSAITNYIFRRRGVCLGIACVIANLSRHPRRLNGARLATSRRTSHPQQRAAFMGPVSAYAERLMILRAPRLYYRWPLPAANVMALSSSAPENYACRSRGHTCARSVSKYW